MKPIVFEAENEAYDEEDIRELIEENKNLKAQMKLYSMEIAELKAGLKTIEEGTSYFWITEIVEQLMVDIQSN